MSRRRIYPGTYQQRILAVLDDRLLLPQQDLIRMARMAPATAITTLAHLLTEGLVELTHRPLAHGGPPCKLYRRKVAA